MDKLRWTFVTLFFLFILIESFNLGPTLNALKPIFSVSILFIASSLHGLTRYGWINIIVFFIITWLVSNTFEAISIQTGFPFGHYHYAKLASPRIFEVPIIIMFAYFSMAYLSWMLAHILLRNYHQRLEGGKVFYIPIISAFIMVMWDLCMDPISSTIDSLWRWRDGGAYFGVPLQNYFGWILVVYLIFQFYAFYIAKSEHNVVVRKKSFWVEVSILYGIQAFYFLLRPFVESEYIYIFRSMALITIFTMIFVTALSLITIKESSFK